MTTLRWVGVLLAGLSGAAEAQSPVPPSAAQLPPGFGVSPQAQPQAPPAGAPPVAAPPAPAPGAEAPKPGAAGQNLDEKFQRFLVGEWSVDVPYPSYPSARYRAQVRYNPDLSYRGYVQVVAPPVQGMQPMVSTQPVSGTWSVQGLNETRFTLTTRGNSGDSTSVLDILDENRVRNNDANYVAVRVGR